MLSGIQACRALAALMVVLFHAAGNLAKEKYFGSAAEYLDRIFYFGGQAGVAFFFVLSGFIIHYVHEQDFDHPDRYWEYIKKRLIRIYPAYLTIFLGVFALAYATPSLRPTMPTDPSVLVKSLLLMPQDSAAVGGTGAPVIVVAWSLQYEMFFYALFSLAILSRKLLYGALVLIILNVLVSPIMGQYGFLRSFISSHHLALFALGVFASLATDRGNSSEKKFYSSVAVGIGLTGFAFTALWANSSRQDPEFVVIDLLYGVSAALAIYGLVRLESVLSKSQIIKSIAFFGESSDALYLLHFPLASVLSKLFVKLLPISQAGALFALAMMVTISLSAALVFHVIFERPILWKLKKIFLKKRETH